MARLGAMVIRCPRCEGKLPSLPLKVETVSGNTHSLEITVSPVDIKQWVQTVSQEHDCEQVT